MSALAAAGAGAAGEASSPRQLQRFVGVYNADGSFLGEVAYFFGKYVSGAHCSLCDITHGARAAKPEYLSLCSTLSVPLVSVHLDERSPAVKKFMSAGRVSAPCVLAEFSDGGIELVASDARLTSCKGSVPALAEILKARVAAAEAPAAAAAPAAAVPLSG